MNNLNKNAQNELKRLVEQIERLEEERKGLAADVADKFKEAESKGFDKKIMRKVLAIRKRDSKDVTEEEQLIATYLAALGWEATPLGQLQAAE